MCIASQHSAAAFTRVLDMEMLVQCSDHVLTARTGGIFFLSDTRAELSVLKKTLCQVGRERGSPWASAVPKFLIQTSLISIHRHRLSSVIRLNTSKSLSRCFISWKKKLKIKKTSGKCDTDCKKWRFLSMRGRWEENIIQWTGEEVNLFVCAKYACSVNPCIDTFKRI